MAEMPTDGGRVAHGVVAGEERRTASRNQKGGKDAKKGSLSGAVGAEESDRLALRNFKRNSPEGGTSGSGEGLKEGAPAAGGRGKRFLE